MNGRPSVLSAALIEAVRSRARIEDCFPAAALKRSGRSFVTHCPWHDDRHPSLTVSPQRNRVQCFVCQRGADPIGWIQDRQGLTFPEAVRELARRYAIPIPEEDPQAATRATAEHQERQRLLQWCRSQLQHFHQAMLADLEDVRLMLARDPWSELLMILNWLEPLEPQVCYGLMLEGMGAAGDEVSAREKGWSLARHQSEVVNVNPTFRLNGVGFRLTSALVPSAGPVRRRPVQ